MEEDLHNLADIILNSKKQKTANNLLTEFM